MSGELINPRKDEWRTPEDIEIQKNPDTSPTHLPQTTEEEMTAISVGEGKIDYSQEDNDQMDREMGRGWDKRKTFSGVDSLDKLIRIAKENEDFTLYVDLDGVLADFAGGFKKLGYGDIEEFKKDHTSEDLYHVIRSKDPHFFLHLDWMEGGEELWDVVKEHNPKILTTPAQSIKHCKDDKKKWVEQHLGSDIEVIFSSTKGDYADNNSILIDDMDKNLIPWKEAQGIAIKHTSTPNTLAKLKKLFGKITHI